MISDIGLGGGRTQAKLDVEATQTVGSHSPHLHRAPSLVRDANEGKIPPT